MNILVFNDDYDELMWFPDLYDIEVLAISNAKADDIKNLEEDEFSSNNDYVPATVTLKTTFGQAQDLVMAENIGKIHLVFVNRGGSIQWEN